MLLYTANESSDADNFFVTLSDAFLKTMDSISFGNSLEVYEKYIAGEKTDVLEPLQSLYLCFISVLAPTLAARAVLVVFRDAFTQIRCYLNIRDDLHIFSELNEKTLTLAKSIVSVKKNSKVVFTGIDRNTVTNLFYVEQARKINALMTKRTVGSFRINQKIKNKKVLIYFLGEDESNNLKSAIDKFEKIKDMKRKAVLFVFSTSESAENIIDLSNKAVEKGVVRLELFNEAQRTAYNLLFDHPLFDVNSDYEKINVMILGAGRYGTEFAKAAAWCSQMLTRSFSIRLFDKDDKTDDISFPFNDLVPRLESIGTNLDFEFIQCDVFSRTFDFKRFNRADYIIVSLGEDDKLNLDTALKIRKLYSRRKTEDAFVPSCDDTPKIFPLIRSNTIKQIALALNDENIIPFGSFEDVFSFENISEWNIDKVAEYIHACYECNNKISYKNMLFTNDLFHKCILSYSHQDEVNKSSSRAAAIHTVYKLFDLGLDINEASLRSDEYKSVLNERYNELLGLEHDRWNVFQMLDGWDVWDENELSDEKNIRIRYQSFMLI